MTLQQNYGSSVIFPPTPVIQDQKGLELSIEHWKKSCSWMFIGSSSIRDANRPMGMLLTIDPRFFRQNIGVFERCIENLEDFFDEASQDVISEMILVRLLNSTGINGPQSEKLRKFVDCLVGFRNAYEKPIGILDSETYSRLGLVVGTNIGGIRLGGNYQTARGGGNGYVEPSNRKVWSQANREWMPTHEFLSNGLNIPNLPQLSSILNETPSVENINQRTQGMVKHVSISEGFSNEINEFRKAIIQRNIRTYENRITETAISHEAQYFLRI
ncbi:MAG: hypothetical protein ACTSYI_03830 [Promethearchaeota archaeon]